METTKKEELTRVQRVSDGKYNLIDADGKLLSDEWFEWVDDFRDGFARVKRADGLYNFINKKGKIISEKWFDFISSFYDGFAVVRKEKFSLMNSSSL